MKTGVVRQNISNETGFRIDPSFHLSEALQIQSDLRHSPYPLHTVADVSEKIFIGNIFSRNFVSKPDHGVPYLAASDTVLSNINTGRFLSKNQAKQLNYLLLQKDWILVTCSGTLGNVTYTNAVFENHIATHDLIRIIPSNHLIKSGVLYAFLASKYGYYQLTQSRFGGVVKHINATHAGNVAIPVFNDSLQAEVNSSVLDSARLREEASYELAKAHDLIRQYISYCPTVLHTDVCSSRSVINSHNSRFESNYYLGKGRAYDAYIRDHFDFLELGSYTTRIFRPGIFKRQYVDKGGVMFLGGADITRAIPSSDKRLSSIQVTSMPELMPKKGWLLVTCGGTIGNVVYVDNQLSRCAISQHVIRIVPHSIEDSYLLFALLSSPIGYDLITNYTYGSVIPQVEPHHLALIPVPVFASDAQSMIIAATRKYVEKIEKAKELETSAISLIEQEIGSWQKKYSR